MNKNFSGSRRAGQPGSTSKAPVAPVEPIVVRPKQACALLGCGLTYLFDLLNKGELESYRDGRSRLITLASIRARVARKLAEAHAGKVA
jgi:excisionase family DNA binding protein